MTTALQARRPVPRVALTLDEAADALGVSRDHLERHILGDLRVIRLGSGSSSVSPNSNAERSGTKPLEPKAAGN